MKESKIMAHNTLPLLFFFLFPLFGLLVFSALGLFIGLIAASLLYVAVRHFSPLAIREEDRRIIQDSLDQIKNAAEMGDNKRVIELVSWLKKKLQERT